ncbi:BTAD domain-containing putative transcriptional regulator [Kitasatospora sp. NPDC086009]|uniref:AfsR/SARP family transcriptional regulator n=1 Tax=unclassified Kitasatospora TaxID=2633591 RepID=UPI0037C706CC
MFIRLLGPVELRAADGRAVEPAGPKRCAVLALLALELGRTVPVERLFELLWGEAPPARARAAVQGHIAALRKQIADSPFTLLTRAPGYRLDGPAELVDALLFERLTALAAGECAPGGDEAAVKLLREALDLWHGGTALANLPETGLRHAVADRLDRRRTRALECWAERLLRLGRGADAVTDLDRAAEADGLHEPLAALLVRCLHQAGRFADALTAYHRTRRRLAEELGLAPGRALQSAVDDMLTADPEPTPAAPAAPTSPPVPVDPVDPPAPRPTVNQLPRAAARFVGRAAEQRWLDAECAGPHGGGSLAVVTGPAGAGKTATVVQWAHAAAGAFPDGLLFADLNGFGPGHRTGPVEVLGRFLRALGVEERELPEDRYARAALYRALTGRRRLLVVLDNAGDAEDLADLLPAGPDCATVITSRSSLEDVVVTEGAALLRLGALPAEDALGLLEHLLTPARVRAEPEASAKVAELCDRLPLALRIAAARLAAQPGWAIADLVPELADERTRLQTLDTQGAISVRSALGLTVRRLSATAVHLLALLAAHPGPETDAHAAAALLATDTAEARRALGSLAAHHLLTEDTPGRYRRHDLIRLYGAELLDERPASERAGATLALVDHFLAAAAHGAGLLQPGLDPFGPPPLPGPARPRLPDVRAALDWFRAEEPTIRGLVTSAADLGDHRRAWRLAYLANCLYYGAGRRTDRLACLRAGLESAVLTGDPAAVASMEASTARALSGLGRAEEAHRLALRAVTRTADAGGDVHVHALTVLAVASAARGEHAEAVRLGERAIALAGAHGLAEHAPFAFSNTAALHGFAGDAGQALRRAREARALLAEHPQATYHLSAMVNEAHALQQLRRPAEAGRAWRETMERCRAAGAVHLEAVAERHYADFLLDADRPVEAASHLRSAHCLYERLGDAGVARQLERRLATLAGAVTVAPSARRALPAASGACRSRPPDRGSPCGEVPRHPEAGVRRSTVTVRRACRSGDHHRAAARPGRV